MSKVRKLSTANSLEKCIRIQEGKNGKIKAQKDKKEDNWSCKQRRGEQAKGMKTQVGSNMLSQPGRQDGGTGLETGARRKC